MQRGTGDITPSQTCVQTRGAPRHCPCLVSLSPATTADICFASPRCSAWIISDLPSNAVWESGREKASIRGDAVAGAARSGSTTSAQSRGIHQNLSEGCSTFPCHRRQPCVTSALPLALHARSLGTGRAEKGDSLLRGLTVACNLP